MAREQLPLRENHDKGHAPLAVPVSGLVLVLMKDRTHFARRQVRRLVQMRFRHPVQYRIVPDTGQILDIQGIKLIQRPPIGKARIHAYQHRAFVPLFERARHNRQHKVEGLSGLVLPRPARAPRMSPLSPDTATRAE